MKKIIFINKNTELFFLISTFLFFNIFIISWNYTYLPLTEGWFLLGGKLIEQGLLPYTDFYAYLTPFYYWYSYFILLLGEETIFISRVLGQINLNILFFLTYKVLNINFPKAQSLITALFSMIFYLSINAILSYDFIHIVNIFALSSFYIIATKKSPRYLFLAGFLAAMCFLTKQSNGAVIFITLTIIFIYKFWHYKRFIFYPCSGAVLAVILNFIPYYNLEALHIIYENIVINAGSAKGGIIHSLTTLIPPRSDFYSFQKLLKFILKIFIPLLIIFKFHKLFTKKIDNFLTFDNVETTNFGIKYLIIFLVLTLIILCFFIFDIKDFFITKSISDFFLNRVYLWAGYCPIIFLLFIKNKSFDKSLGIFLAGLTFAAATSAGLTSVSIFLHVAFLMCLLISFKSLFSIGCIIALTVMFSYSSIYILEKKHKTYHWWGINSYKGSFESKSIPFISKIKNDGLSNHLNIINSKLSNCKNKPSSLIAFPHGAIINLSTNINPPTPTISYWFDFLSNKDANYELVKLKQKSLDVVVIISIQELAWKTHENLFRPEDKYLTQREINKYLLNIVNTDNYQNIYSFYQDKTKVEIFTIKKLLCN